ATTTASSSATTSRGGRSRCSIRRAARCSAPSRCSSAPGTVAAGSRCSPARTDSAPPWLRRLPEEDTMNARTTLVGIALALLANQASATVLAGSADTLPDGGRGALRALEDPALSALRAGKVAQPVPVG